MEKKNTFKLIDFVYLNSAKEKKVKLKHTSDKGRQKT